MKYKLKNGIYYDNNGNSASVEYFGSYEEAIKALDSLINCTSCYNCSNCSNCYDCYNCDKCNNCIYCVDCHNCNNCDNCDNCADCNDCYNNNPLPVKPQKIKDLHYKVFTSASEENTLDMSNWSCGTTMCHGGWIVHHGGETGQELLEKTRYPFAAMQIAKASGIPVSPTMFFVSNEEGMKNIKMLSEMEQS